MRILHIITGLTLAGAEGVLFRLCTAAGRGEVMHAVVALSSEGAHYTEPLRQAGIPVHTLDMPRGRLMLSGLFRLFRIVRELRPDIVQTWLYHADLVGGVVARLAGQRHVAWNLRGSGIDPRRLPLSTMWVIRACAALSARVPARVLCCSEDARTAHIRLGYAADKIVLIPNGFCCETFAPDADQARALRRELGLAEDAVVLGMVARYHPQKDHRNLLDALALVAGRHPRLMCLLIGTGLGDSNAELTTAIARHRLAGTVRLLGPRQDIPAVMNALDLHVLSSAYLEAFPNVIAEAMACGTPCVATDVGDARRIIGTTGWIVPPADSGALARAIDTALGARALGPGWRERQQACRARIVDNFSLQLMVDRYEASWRRILGKDNAQDA
jgi:glycosyltransferase involved in cell wall biosynthesis